MTARKPQKPLDRSPMPHLLTGRVTEVQYRHLVITAERQGVSIAAAVRQLVDAAIDAQPVVTNEDGSPAIKYRNLLGILNGEALEEFARTLPADDAGSSDDRTGDDATA